MMAHGNDTKYCESMNSVSKFCTIPRRHDDAHRPALSSLASLVTPVRETTHSKLFAKEDAEDGGSGTTWRPQPPPRNKRNSIATDMGGHISEQPGGGKISGNPEDFYSGAALSDVAAEHTTSQVSILQPTTFGLK